jgi:hypothetical protein
MKRTFIGKLQRNGAYCIAGALLLLIGIPLYQYAILIPQGFSAALMPTTAGAFVPYVRWIDGHIAQFLGYRVLLMLAFAAILSLPFTLFRIIVAQEIVEGSEVGREAMENASENEESEVSEANSQLIAMPVDAWRGRGFAVFGAWFGFVGILLYILGTLASTIYFALIAGAMRNNAALPGNFLAILGILTVLPNTVGLGLLALACLFLGVIIARRGTRLWPGVWIAFAYVAILVAVIVSASAIAVASAPTQGQGTLATLAILLLALWVLWFGIMLVRLKPEP